MSMTTIENFWKIPDVHHMCWWRQCPQSRWKRTSTLLLLLLLFLSPDLNCITHNPHKQNGGPPPIKTEREIHNPVTSSSNKKTSNLLMNKDPNANCTVYLCTMNYTPTAHLYSNNIFMHYTMTAYLWTNCIFMHQLHIYVPTAYLCSNCIFIYHALTAYLYTNCKQERRTPPP